MVVSLIVPEFFSVDQAPCFITPAERDVTPGNRPSGSSPHPERARAWASGRQHRRFRSKAARWILFATGQSRPPPAPAPDPSTSDRDPARGIGSHPGVEKATTSTTMGLDGAGTRQRGPGPAAAITSGLEAWTLKVPEGSGQTLLPWMCCVDLINKSTLEERVCRPAPRRGLVHGAGLERRAALADPIRRA